MSIIADDLFAGAGGWDVGAIPLGVHARGVENMKEAQATRDAAGLETIHDDVWTFVPDGRASLLIASPPCQTFSAAGSGSGRKALDQVLDLIDSGAYRSIEALRRAAAELGDERTALVLTPLHFAAQYDYETLAWEQVPTVLPVWEACADVLRDQGWNVWTGLVYAEQYGVPQTRKRAVLIASRTREVGRPTPTHSRYYARTPGKLDEGVEKWVSMYEALNFGLFERPAPTITGGGTETGGAEPIAKIEERWASRPDWVGRDDLPEWTRNRPSTTIVGSFKPEIVAAPGFRTTVSRQNAPNSVRVTVEEAGVLQSFPYYYPWQGAKGKTFLQAGNAVPPLMATHILAEGLGMEVPR